MKNAYTKIYTKIIRLKFDLTAGSSNVVKINYDKLKQLILLFYFLLSFYLNSLNLFECI